MTHNRGNKINSPCIYASTYYEQLFEKVDEENGVNAIRKIYMPTLQQLLVQIKI